MSQRDKTVIYHKTNRTFGEHMEAEEAWDMFKSCAANSLQKSASVAGQLDTLAAQMQNIQTGVERLTKLIPQFMGDETAIGQANATAEAPPNPFEEMMGDQEEAMPEDVPEEPAPTDEEGSEADTEEAPEGAEDEVEKAADDGEPDVLETDEESTPEGGDEPEEEDEVAAFERDMPDLGLEEEDIVEEPVEEPAEIPEEEPLPDAGAETGAPPIAEAPEEPAAPAEGIDPQTMDVYAQLLSVLVQAAMKANQNGDATSLNAIAKGVNGIQAAYGAMCPVLDGVMGTDYFTKSYNELNGEDDMEKCGSNAEGTEMEKSVTGAQAPDDMIQKSADTKMHCVEEEKGKEPEAQDGPKLGPSADVSKSATPKLPSMKDMIEKGCGNAKIEDSLEKEDLEKSDSIGETLDTHVETGKKLEDAGIDDSGMEMKKSSTKLPEVPENGSDMSVTGTASENAPDVPEPGEDKSNTGSASTGVKPTIDPGSEKSELQKSESGETPTQSEECNGALAKSLQGPGKHLVSMRDLLTKSAGHPRPDAISTANGDVTTPEFGAPLQKSQSQRVRMGPGVDPHEVTKADWERYKLFKAQGRF